MMTINKTNEAINKIISKKHYKKATNLHLDPQLFSFICLNNVSKHNHYQQIQARITNLSIRKQ